ncbi:hypothetical protein JYB87_05565 [Shewanella avicenniae]|uniref:Toxin CptA n=1 Tax=Shewanella avicenniae TaxID=2814294 RepID=A0ABX7QTF1_9GAMM|nr:protein YgfX [Shewanella avicenniae]QSX34704.1 hypothetical protein JYB87_05565 [Shewanella avicenniae]
MQRHSFHLASSLCQQLSFLLLAAALLSSFWLWPDIKAAFYLPLKYLLFTAVVIALVWQFRQLKKWQLTFSLDEYGRGLQPSGAQFSVGDKLWVSPWLTIFFMQKDGQKLPILLFADMFSGDDYRHLCRLLLNRRPSPTQPEI